MSAQFKHIGNQLAAKGIEVLYCDMTELNHATGGGMRCSHGPLVRED
jgi:N-dimethylarginine dimethylaminohydrolase